MSASAVLEDSEAAFADISVHLEKTKAEVWSRSDGLALRAEGLAAPSIHPWFWCYSVVSLCSPGPSEAGGQGASGGGADGARHRDAGERAGGAEEEGPGDQSSPPKWGQRPLFTGELEKRTSQ